MMKKKKKHDKNLALLEKNYECNVNSMNQIKRE